MYHTFRRLTTGHEPLGKPTDGINIEISSDWWCKAPVVLLPPIVKHLLTARNLMHLPGRQQYHIIIILRRWLRMTVCSHPVRSGGYRNVVAFIHSQVFVSYLVRGASYKYLLYVEYTAGTRVSTRYS